MNQQELIPHLFRTEFGKITAVLCRTFGFSHLETAEDIASDSFLAALESWPFKGIPENPTAWLYTVARNKALNLLKRDNLFREKIAANLKPSGTEDITIDLTVENISDSQLQMIFAVCHPSLPPESQIALALRILCGFGIEEIATAFLTNKETINKRLARAKEKLRQEKVSIEFPGKGMLTDRLDNVIATLYLLFNEGYYSESRDTVLREDLCFEAMRLTTLLIENPTTNLPAVNALYSLMCFHASRFPARKDETGELILYGDQDEGRWDQAMITQGARHLRQAATGDSISTYHLEAAIAFWHTTKTDTPEKWQNILQLYDQLLTLQYSPVAALNRTFALSKVKGNHAAIREAEKLALTRNHYYYVLLGELYKNIDPTRSRENFQQALLMAKTQTDRQVIKKTMAAL